MMSQAKCGPLAKNYTCTGLIFMRAFTSPQERAGSAALRVLSRIPGTGREEATVGVR